MHSFVYGLLGGALIGLSASVLLLFSGDVLGASGIVTSIGLTPVSSFRDPSQHWKLVLVAAFLMTSHLFFATKYQDKENGLASLSWAAYLIGGFFVGFGTKLGNGCTSGHGICGLARFSKRSFAAVLSFMSIGMLTAYLTQAATSPLPDGAFAFLRNDEEDPSIEIWRTAGALLTFVLALAALLAPSFHTEDPTSNSRTKLAPATVSGVLFASGLYLSQMVYPIRIFGFLNFGLIPQGEWDATLMFVMGGGVVISFLSYQFVEGYAVLKNVPPLSKPLALSDGSSFCVPTNSVIDRDLVLGAMCFGLGWGISGLCPGPAMFLAAIGVSWVLVCYWPAFFVGAYLATLVVKRCSCCRPATTPAEEETPTKPQDAKPAMIDSTVHFDIDDSRTDVLRGSTAQFNVDDGPTDVHV